MSYYYNKNENTSMANINNLTSATKSRVERILSGVQKIKNTDSYTYYSVDELAQLQAAFDKRLHLTAPEAGLWLGKSMSTIYRLIAAGKIAVLRGNANSEYTVDVRKTRELLSQR